MEADICAHSSFKVPNHRLYFFAKELEKRGYNLNFIVPGKQDVISCKEKFPGCNAIDVGLNVSRFKNSKLLLYPVFSMRARKKFSKNAAFLYGVCLPANLAVDLAKINAPKIIDYLDLWSEYWHYANTSLKAKAIYSAVRYCESYSVKKADLVLTITDFMAKQLEERGCNLSKIRVIRDGVDTKRFYPFKVKSHFYDKYNLDKDTDYVVFQGGVERHDGVQFLVNAAINVIKAHPNVKFLIVGTGTHLPKIKEMVAKNGLENNFIFTGWVNYEEMPSFMNIANINCVPLPDSPATRGVVTYKLFEAMACGTPTVIGNMPAVRDLTQGKSACLVKSEDTPKLAKAILALLEQKKVYNNVRNKGLALVKNHDWRDIAKDMVNVLEHEI